MRTQLPMMLGLLAGMSAMPARLVGYGKSLNKLFSAPRPPKNYPRMVTSTREEIAAHNEAVTTRQVIRRKTRPWKLAARWDAA